MNENIDLTKILKDCPKGWKFYSLLYGEVEFDKIRKESEYPIVIITKHGNNSDIKSDGRYYGEYGDDGECTLFPSKDQRDWSKFSAPWYKKDKFDPKTLKPFDKVIGRHSTDYIWSCDFFSHIGSNSYPYRCVSGFYKCCIPYNDDTKHLVGTTDEAPEYYRYWEE